MKPTLVVTEGAGNGKKVAKKRKAPTAKIGKALQKTSTEKYAMAATTIALLAVSLVHLADGVQLLTDCPAWQAWAMSIGIDAMFVAVEWSALKQGADTYATSLTAATLMMSAYLNALAFCHGHYDVDHAAAIGFGVFIPFAIFLATNRLAKLK
jgi:hypothetical protein